MDLLCDCNWYGSDCGNIGADYVVLVDKKENSGIYSGELFSALKPRNWKKTFTLADAGVIAFWAFAGISTLQSEWLYEAFWGMKEDTPGFS